MVPESIDGKALAVISYGKWDNLFAYFSSEINLNRLFFPAAALVAKIVPSNRYRPDTLFYRYLIDILWGIKYTYLDPSIL